MQASPRSSLNVVRLRPLQGLTPGDAGSFEPGDAASLNGGFEPGNNGSLSSSEHFAFQEIARALGARIEGSELPAEVPGDLPPVRPLGEAPSRPAVLEPADNAGALPEATGPDHDPLVPEAASSVGDLPGMLVPAHEARFDADDPGTSEGNARLTDGGGHDTASLRPAHGAGSVIEGPHGPDPERAIDAARLRALLDTAGDAIATIDESGRMLTLNRQGERWFGRDRRQLAGESFTFLLAQESRAAAGALLARIATSPGASAEVSREFVARTPEGTAMPLLMTLTRIERGFYAAVWRDLSAIKRLESELARAQVEAERARGQQPEFLAKVSHEIRTPLNAILGFAEIMMDERFGSLGNSRYKDYLQDIHASGTRVMSLVNDLLDLSRIEAGRLELELGSVEINKVIGDCVTQLQPEAHRERVIVRTSLGARLPAVRADERSVVQIVTNLLSNAVKFNEPGGQVIVSTALSDTGAVVARIRDTGIGMSDADIAAALEPFRQLAPSNKQAVGAGLGLPLTKALVGANGAALSIRSRLGEGTLVEVMFTPATNAANRVPA